MGTRSRIARWGTSLAVRIPGPIAEQWGVREGSAIEMILQGDRVVMRKTYDLDDLLEQVTPGNLHPEASRGPAQGHERW